MGNFVVKKRANGEFQFNLKAGNGEIILASEGYNTKQGCLNGIESVRKNSLDDSRYDKKTTSNGQYYFNLTATNGQTIGTSEHYTTSSSRDNGIESVKKNAPGANVEDNS